MMTNEYLVLRKKGKKNKAMAYYMCPHCGYEHVIDINKFILAYVNAGGEFVCAKCGKGFKVSIDEKTKRRVEKYKERRRR